MRPKEKQKLTSFISNDKSWSINDGDYIKSSPSGEETFRKFRKKEKIKKLFVTFFLILSGYIGLLLILIQLSDI